MSCYAETFRQLDTLLTELREYWQFLPFADTDFVWRQQHPDFCDWLINIDDQQLINFSQDHESLVDALSEWIPHAKQLNALAQVEQLLGQESNVPQWLETGIPGRKWQQINAFNAALPRLGLPWLEWCAGKGHLGRVLSFSHGQAVTSLEWQQTLCEEGDLAAKKRGLPINFVQADAFSETSKQYIKSEQHAVALHACGDLHVSLLQHVAAQRGSAVTVSPCCYHLIRNSHYQPISRVAQESKLVLTKHDLRLPLQETVTAGNRVRQLRFVEISYRLGFDLLQREINQTTNYMPVPNVQKAILKEGFDAFCHWAAEKKNVVLPSDTDFSHWQQLGERRFNITERMELVRQLFRRPLEIWLALDRVCYMEDMGYSVTLGAFCAKPVTPRNLLIHAELK